MAAIEPAPISTLVYNTGLDALKEMGTALATDTNHTNEPAPAAKSNNILATAATAQAWESSLFDFQPEH